jgi:hypothetical protein
MFPRIPRIPGITRRTCSWCHTVTAERECPDCGHRSDVPRLDCDCARCRRFESPKDVTGSSVAAGDVVEFDEPYGTFAGGRVVAVTRGVLGPVARVEVAPRRVVDVLCRRVRKVPGPTGAG